MRGAIGVRWGRGGVDEKSHAAANVVPRVGLLDDEQVHGVVQVDDLDHQGLHVVVEDQRLARSGEVQRAHVAVAVVNPGLLAVGLGAEAPDLEVDLGGVVEQELNVVAGKHVGRAEAVAGGIDHDERDIHALGQFHAPAERVWDGQDLSVGQEAQQAGAVEQAEDVAVEAGEEVSEGGEVVEVHGEVAPCR